jgi:hypothetical protein
MQRYKLKDKSSVHITKTYSGRRGIAPVILSLGINPYSANVENMVSS